MTSFLINSSKPVPEKDAIEPGDLLFMISSGWPAGVPMVTHVLSQEDKQELLMFMDLMLTFIVMCDGPTGNRF